MNTILLILFFLVIVVLILATRPAVGHDQARLDFLESVNAALLWMPSKEAWAVLAGGALLSTGATPREAVDAAIRSKGDV